MPIWQIFFISISRLIFFRLLKTYSVPSLLSNSFFSFFFFCYTCSRQLRLDGLITSYLRMISNETVMSKMWKENNIQTLFGSEEQMSLISEEPSLIEINSSLFESNVRSLTRISYRNFVEIHRCYNCIELTKTSAVYTYTDLTLVRQNCRHKICKFIKKILLL